MTLGLLLAGLIGISLGLLGGGGSTLAVPILLYVSRFPAREAIVMSLVVVGVTSFFAALQHWRWRNVDGRAALVFGVISMAGSFAGGRLARFVSEEFQLTLFAIVMLAASAFMFRSGARRRAGAPLPAARSPLLVGAAGVGVGLLTGLVGVGGGFLIVPSLVLLVGLDMKRAVGTSLVVIAMNCAAGYLGYSGHVTIDWRYAAMFTTVAVAGSVIGTRLVRYVSQPALKKAFAVFLIAVGAYVLFHSRDLQKQPHQAPPQKALAAGAHAVA